MDKQTVLDNGITIITHNRDSKSIGLVCGVKYGNMHDPPEKAGLAHFFEHLMMSGSKKRPSMEAVFQALGRSGGTVQATTGRERTYIHANFLARELPIALDTCMDCLLHPILSDEAIACEKQVISKEITMIENTIERDMYQVSAEALYPNHPLSTPPVGTRETIANFTRDDITQAHQKNYIGKNIILCATGAVNHEELVRLASAYPVNAGIARTTPALPLPLSERSFAEHQRNSKQHVFTLGFRISSNDVQTEATAMIADAILGSGPTSTLFKSIRTKHALAYGVKSECTFTSLGGDWRVFVLSQKEHFPKVEELIIQGCEQFLSEINENRLQETKEKLKGKIILSSEPNLEYAKSTFFAAVRGITNYYENLLSALDAVDSAALEKFAKQTFLTKVCAVGTIT